MNKAIRCITQKYAVFAGRAGRAEYWGFVLLVLPAVMLTIGLDITLGLYGADAEVGFVGLLTAILKLALLSPFTAILKLALLFPLTIMLRLALLLPFVAVSARRLHDINRSGWWEILPPALAIGILLLVPLFGESVLWWLLVPGAGFCLLLAVYLLPGDKGENRFGAPPA